jgi:hypothetical protein
MEFLKKASEVGIEGFSPRKERQGLPEANRRGNRMQVIFRTSEIRPNREK